MKANHCILENQECTDNEAQFALRDALLPPTHLTSMELLRAIRLPEVLHMTGLSRSAWYALLNPRMPNYDSLAPRPFKLGTSERSPSAWWAWEVLAYLQAKSAARSAH